MSKNKDLIKLLSNIKYKSFSKIDKKYNKIFKEYNIDNLIYHNNFADEVRKKWSNNYNTPTSGSKIRTTNEKLKQIINSNKNASKIQDIFFKTFDKEPLYKKIIKKENSNEKLINIKYNSNSLSTKINKIIENRKKFNISNTFLKRRHEENNRQPPICLYNPKYNYIYKHVPGFNFQNEKRLSRKKNINLDQIEKSNLTKEFNNTNVDRNTNKINNNIINSKSVNSLTPIHISNNKSYISFIGLNNKDKNKEIEENKNITSNKKSSYNFFLSQQGAPSSRELHNKIKLDYSPKMIEKNVLVPNFDKMIPRFGEKSKKYTNLTNLDYSPNYDAIFSHVLNNNPIDYERRRKFYYLKKIISTYNPTSEYLLFPELNIKE